MGAQILQPECCGLFRTKRLLKTACAFCGPHNLPRALSFAFIPRRLSSVAQLIFQIFLPNAFGERWKNSCCALAVLRSGWVGCTRWESLDQMFPEIKALIDVPQDPEWHPEGDVFVHTRLVIDGARDLIDDLPYAKQVTVMLAALAHDFGKPATTEFVDGRLRSRGHEEAGVAPAQTFLDQLNIHTLDGYDVRAQVIALVREHLKPGEFFKKRDEVGDGAFRRLARKCELDLLYRVAKADSLGRNADWVPREKWYGSEAQEWFIQRARELAVEQQPPAPILLGRHLLEMGLSPGPRVGEITKAVYEMQLDGRVSHSGRSE